MLLCFGIGCFPPLSVFVRPVIIDWNVSGVGPWLTGMTVGNWSISCRHLQLIGFPDIIRLYTEPGWVVMLRQSSVVPLCMQYGDLQMLYRSAGDLCWGTAGVSCLYCCLCFSCDVSLLGQELFGVFGYSFSALLTLQLNSSPSCCVKIVNKQLSHCVSAVLLWSGFGNWTKRVAFMLCVSLPQTVNNNHINKKC